MCVPRVCLVVICLYRLLNINACCAIFMPWTSAILWNWWKNYLNSTCISWFRYDIKFLYFWKNKILPSHVPEGENGYFIYFLLCRCTIVYICTYLACNCVCHIKDSAFCMLVCVQTKKPLKIHKCGFCEYMLVLGLVLDLCDWRNDNVGQNQYLSVFMRKAPNYTCSLEYSITQKNSLLYGVELSFNSFCLSY